MPGYADIYTLSTKRTAEFVKAFVDHFLPEYEESAVEYEIPQYADQPEIMFYTAPDLIEYCCTHLSAVQTIYWHNTTLMRPEHAMVFFLSDGHVVFGLSTDMDDEDEVQRLFNELQSFVGSTIAYVTYEEVPGLTAEEFIDLARRRPFFREMKRG